MSGRHVQQSGGCRLEVEKGSRMFGGKRRDGVRGDTGSRLVLKISQGGFGLLLVPDRKKNAVRKFT